MITCPSPASIGWAWATTSSKATQRAIKIHSYPGYRIPVAELKWDQDRTTRDVRELQPLNGYAFREIACARSQKATTSSSMEDYQEEANIATSLEGEYGAFGLLFKS